MTDKERAIITAYTGITMLTGEKFSIFHKYIEDLLGRPIWTHELANPIVWQEIKEKSKKDFLDLCEEDRKGEWIPVGERMPEYTGLYLISIDELVTVANFTGTHFMNRGGVRVEVNAWQPLPEPYKEADNE